MTSTARDALSVGERIASVIPRGETLRVPAGVAIICVATGGGCARASESGGPLAQFNGEYRILELAEASAVDEALPALRKLARLQDQMSWLMAPDRTVGTVTVVPLLGHEYSEWTVRFEDPDHKMRMIVGSPTADGTFPIWRFEQEPAPKLRKEGRGHLENDTLIAEFTWQSDSRALFRERWARLPDGRLEFVLETHPEGAATPRRVGGFVAVPN